MQMSHPSVQAELQKVDSFLHLQPFMQHGDALAGAQLELQGGSWEKTSGFDEIINLLTATWLSYVYPPLPGMPLELLQRF